MKFGNGNGDDDDGNDAGIGEYVGVGMEIGPLHKQLPICCFVTLAFSVVSAKSEKMVNKYLHSKNKT